MNSRAQSYWAFMSNPDRYRIEEAVRDLARDSWATKGSHVRAGDRAIIWKARGRSKTRGVIALAEILTDPVPSTDLFGSQYAVPPIPAAELAQLQPELRVTVRYLDAPGLPLWVGGPATDLLRTLRPFDAQGGTVFHVDPGQWAAVMAAVGGWPVDEIAAAQTEIAAQGGKRRPGQGFQSDPELRRIVERYAMERAIVHYEAQRWRVEDVSMQESFDLLCTRSGEELHVEVKGTTSEGEQILLTANEVRHTRAQYPRTALFIIANILISRSSTGALVAVGGDTRIFEPWEVQERDLTAIAYSYIPRGND